MKQSPAGAPLPVRTNERWYMVVSPKGETKIRGTILADTFLGVWVHWDGCALPCTETHDCPACKAGLGHRWQGYVAFWQWGVDRRVVLALSEGAARQLLKPLDEYGSLRGVSIEMARKFPRKPNSSLLVKVTSRHEPAEIMGEHPITDSLNRLWGLNMQFWAKKTGGINLPPVPPVRVGSDCPEPDDEQPGKRCTAAEFRQILAEKWQIPDQ